MLTVTNPYGISYTVIIHQDPNYEGRPVVGFHKGGFQVDRVPLYSYFASTLLEMGEGGLLLDGSRPMEFVTKDDMESVRNYIELHMNGEEE